ncbi:amino acid adenylation domain-containing protein [Methylomonas sp. HYX-M1]|uniref:amino acid adenylation domain-containing protein n=1 Tax=Methylomonas sp. HYX-M1 TaxID=3139307 RepID=UPI00345BB3FE
MRRGADGVVVYLGRADQQIKLRGYRIEPGEIEAALRQLPGIDDAYVLLREDDGRRYLTGYWQPSVAAHAHADSSLGYAPHTKTDAYPSEAQLKTALAERLPDYMVPARLLRLQRLPRTAHGKIDRRALPAPTRSTTEAQAPRTPTETLLLQLWQDLLGRETIGVHDNFFELGGDSIVSIQLVSRARAQGLSFSPKDLFQHQTVAGLAQVARPLAASAQAPTGPAVGTAPLLPIQHTFFAQHLTNPAHWNQSLLLKARVPLSAEVLAQALQTLVLHHDSLNLRYVRQADGWQQTYAPATDVTTNHAALLQRHTAQDAADIRAIADKAQRSLNLERGPLFQATLIDLADGSQRLLLLAHHLIVDAVSWRILLEDLGSAYRQIAQGHPPQLPGKTASYQTWGDTLQAYARSPALQAQRDYWQRQLPTDPAWPCDHPNGRAQQRDRASLSLSLEAAQTEQLLQPAHAAYRTRIQDLLLTALAQTLCDYSGQAQVCIALEGHGREAELIVSDAQTPPDLSRSVGWFTSVYPVKLSGDADPASAVKTVKEQLRQVPDRGLGYGVIRYLAGPAADAEQTNAITAEPPVLFNYLGQLDNSFDRDALLEPAAEPGGEERDPGAPLAYALEINAEVYQGRLRIEWSYSRERYREQTIAELIRRYRTRLQALLAHCLTAKPCLTPSDLPLAGLDQAQLEALPLDHADIEDLYPLSPMQQGILFHALREPEANLYVTQLAVDLRGLDAQRFLAAWREVGRRHPILRSGFFWHGDWPTPLQAVFRQADVPTIYLDWRQRPIDRTDLAALAQADYAGGFDLTKPPLQRLTLVDLPGGLCRIIWTSHHLLLDGWSSSLLFGEVMTIYAGQVPEPSGRYRDYIAWLAGRDRAAGQAFWRQTLQDAEQACLLAACLSAQPEATGHGYWQCRLSEQETAELQSFTQQQHLTVNTLLQGAWALVLAHYTGLRMPVFGSTVAGRPAEVPDAERALGLFINTLPLAVRMESGRPAADWLRALQAMNLHMREYEYLPLYDMQRWAGSGGGELFDTLLVFENYPVDAALRQAAGGVKVVGLEQRDRTNYPLTLDVSMGRVLEIGFDYGERYFSPADVHNLAERLRRVLLGLIRAPQQRLGAISFEDRQSHATPTPAMPTDTVLLPELIRRQAQINPQAEAVRVGDSGLSYSELQRRADALAACLVAQGLKPGEVAGVCLPRSADMLVASLALWQCGAAFVPLDPDYPAERLQYMLEDAGAAWWIGWAGEAEDCAAPIAPLPGKLRGLFLDRLDLSGVAQQPPAAALHPESLAYLIYTSGSSGQPKGVAVAHGALARHCAAMAELYGLHAGERCLHFASFSFDAAIEQWAVPLLCGATVIIGDPARWSLEQTLQTLHEQGISRIDLPPAYLAELARCLEPEQTLPALLGCTVGGEALPREQLALIQSRVRPKRMFNAYGPTECVISPLVWQAEAACDSLYAPIGRCVGARNAYILDADLNPLPSGAAGELYIGGLDLAQGYRHRPGASAERFLPDPFAGPGARMYRSGDRARRRGDGVIEFLGRADGQLKLRGYRIEPGKSKTPCWLSRAWRKRRYG